KGVLLKRCTGERRLVSGGTIGGLIGGRHNSVVALQGIGCTSHLYCDFYRYYSSVCAVRTVYSPPPILGIEPKVYRAFHAVIRRYHPEQHLSYTYRYAPAFACHGHPHLA